MRSRTLSEDRRGMVTSEYAVGTVMTVAFVAVLIQVIDTRPLLHLLLRFWMWVFSLFGW